MATESAVREFLAMLSMTGLLHPRKGAPDALAGPNAGQAKRQLVTIWHALLSDIDDAQLSAAAAGYLRDPKVCQWYPQPGQILSRVPGARADQVDDADVAWGECLAWCRQNAMQLLYGSAGREPVAAPWDEDAPRARALSRAMDAIGGPKALLNLGDRQLSTDTEAALRASFRNAYRAMRQQQIAAREDDSVRRLTGGAGRRALPTVEGLVAGLEQRMTGGGAR